MYQQQQVNIPIQNLITQAGQNQVMPELPLELKNQIQGFQKFSKEGCPEEIGVLGPQKPQNRGKKTLVLDLDETLVHSSFKTNIQPDIVLPVEIEGTLCNVFVLVRPGTELFLQRLSKVYELVIYTASLSKYADPLIDILDNHEKKVIDGRLFREHCTFVQSVFIKDMSLIGRDLARAIIIDNSPTSYTFHQENALPILSWYDDMKDRCLFELIPLLEALAEVDDVRKYIPKFVTIDNRIDFQRASQVLANARPQLQKIDEESKQISQRSSVKRKQIEILENEEDSELENEQINKINEEINKEREKQEKLFQEIKKTQKDLLYEEDQDLNPQIDIKQENINLIPQSNQKPVSIFKKFKEKHETQTHRDFQKDKLINKEEEIHSKFIFRGTESGKRKHKIQFSNNPNISKFDQNNDSLGLVQLDYSNKFVGQKRDLDEVSVPVLQKPHSEVRPVTRDPKRSEQQLPDTMKATQPVSVKAMKAQQKTRKISKQYYSRGNQLQQLLQIENKNQIFPPDLNQSQPLISENNKASQPKTPLDTNYSKPDTVQTSIQKLQQLNNVPLQYTPKSSQLHSSRFFGQNSNQNSNQTSIHVVANDLSNFSSSRDYSQRNLKQNTAYNLRTNQPEIFANSTQFINQQRKKKRVFENTQDLIISKESSTYSLNTSAPIQFKTPNKNQGNMNGNSKNRGRALQIVNERRNNSKQSLQLESKSINKYNDQQVQPLSVSNSVRNQQANRPSSAKKPNVNSQSFQNIQPHTTTNQQVRQQFGNLIAAFEQSQIFTVNRQSQQNNEQVQFSPVNIGQQRQLFKAANKKTISQRRIIQQND